MTARTVDAEPIYYDPYDYAIDANPHPVWRRMREEQPLYWNDKYGFWAVSRFEDVWNAYHDTTTFSSTHGVQLEQLDAPAPFKMMIFMDPPEHAILRKIISRAFTPRRMAQLEDSIGALAARYLDPFIGTPGARGGDPVGHRARQRRRHRGRGAAAELGGGDPGREP